MAEPAGMAARGARRMRWPLVVGLIFASLLGGIALAEWAGWPGLAPWLAQRFNSQDSAGPQVALGEGSRIHLILRPRLIAIGLTLARPGEAGTLAVAEALELEWLWTDVWRWKKHGQALRLQAVEVDHLQLSWTRDAALRGNWQGHSQGNRPQQGAGSEDAPLALPEIGHLRIANGSLTVDDQPLQLKATAKFHTSTEGGWHADVQGSLRQQVLSLQASASANLPLLSHQGGPPVQLKASLRQGSSTLEFDGTAASLLDAQELNGQIRVSGASLAAVGKPLGLSLPRSQAFELQGGLLHRAGVWRLTAAQARVGRSRLAGDFAFMPGLARPKLTGTLRGGPLMLADLGSAIGTDEKPKRADRVLPDRPFDIPALSAMDAQLSVSLTSLDSGTAAVAPLTPVDAVLVLDDGVLRISQLRAGVGGGVLTGETTLDSKTSPPQWTAKLMMQGLAIDRWLPVLQHSQAGPGMAKSYLTGQLEANAQMRGRGRSVAELLATLDGEFDAVLRKGSLSHLITEGMGLDIAQGLGIWLRGDDNLALNCAVVKGRVRAGVVHPKWAVIDSNDSRIDMSGNINLATEQIHLRVVAQPKDFSPLSLRAPLRVEGSLAMPHLALEGSALGAKLIAAIALGALAAPAALIPFIDTGGDVPPLACP
ncbi:AsmA family protein [Paucibacter sp. B2R-40]|uniref:AsmA family protein n=1 Tax=Paucibacter sp. B2R-40 TaxID=2893554 RepID=UPI0021E37017|nr:AsmA family protein [Paucibacter sp. B2R-40]MCV2355603.1 AsmA family protein [Paucibacter sp. B2R-40]